jgi:hypothetical protein
MCHSLLQCPYRDGCGESLSPYRAGCRQSLPSVSVLTESCEFMDTVQNSCIQYIRICVCMFFQVAFSCLDLPKHTPSHLHICPHRADRPISFLVVSLTLMCARILLRPHTHRLQAPPSSPSVRAGFGILSGCAVETGRRYVELRRSLSGVESLPIRQSTEIF